MSRHLGQRQQAKASRFLENPSFTGAERIWRKAFNLKKRRGSSSWPRPRPSGPRATLNNAFRGDMKDYYHSEDCDLAVLKGQDHRCYRLRHSGGAPRRSTCVTVDFRLSSVIDVMPPSIGRWRMALKLWTSPPPPPAAMS